MSYQSSKRKRPASTRSGLLWRYPDFLKLWAGESISLMGSQITTLALPLTAVFLFRASSWQLGLLKTAETAPFLFLSLFAGVWVDHQRRRPTLIFTNVGRAILLGLIPLLTLFGWLQIEWLYLIALLVGCLTVFFYLAYQAFLPTLVQRDQLVEGNSKLSASQSLAEIGGPGLAGVLVQIVSAPIAITVDALSFLVSAISLMLIHTPEPVPAAPVKPRKILQEIGEGFRVTFSNPYLRAFSGEAATYNFFWQVILTIFVLYAVRELHFTPGILGLTLAIGSVGALVGAFLTGPLARRIGVGPTIVSTAILSDVALLALPFISRTTPNALLFLLLAFFLQGVGLTGCNVHVDSIRQALIPDRLQGRVNASYRLLVSGVLPLGSLLGGWLGTWLGLQATLLVGALGLVFTCLWIICSPIPRLRKPSTITDEIPEPASKKILPPEQEITQGQVSSSDFSLFR